MPLEGLSQGWQDGQDATETVSKQITRFFTQPTISLATCCPRWLESQRRCLGGESERVAASIPEPGRHGAVGRDLRLASPASG